jgi:hypothetical protein
MSETLPRTASAPDQADNVPTADELHARVYGPENQAQPTPERNDTRELSRSANVLYRIGDFLKERKLNKLHSKALKEYRSDHYLDYVGHINKLADSDNEDYQAYAQPIAEREAPRAERERNKLHDEALKEYRSEHRDDFVEHVGKLAQSDDEQVSEYGQTQLNRENRRIGREKFINDAKTFTRKTGTAALEVAKTTGLFTLGMSVVAGEALGSGAKKVYEVGKDTAETGAIAALYGMDIVKDKLADYAESAKIRRDMRRQKWDSLKTNLTKRGREAMINAKDRKNKAVIGAHALRAAVSNGVATGAKSATDTYRSLNQ